MNNSRFDPRNYLKHGSINIFEENWQILEKDSTSLMLGSNLLLIYWYRSSSISKGGSKASKDSIYSGKVKIRETTPLGIKKPLEFDLDIAPSRSGKFLQFLTVPNDFEYTIECLHPAEIERSCIEIWEFIPLIGNYSNNMPWIPEETSTPQSDPALIAATTANATAIANLATAVAAQPQVMADLMNNNDVTTLDPAQKAVGTTPVLLLAANDDTQGCLINNQGNTKIKLFITDSVLSPTTGYNSNGHIFDMTGKGLYEVPAPFYKSNIYGVGNLANGLISVTQSISA